MGLWLVGAHRAKTMATTTGTPEDRMLVGLKSGLTVDPLRLSWDGTAPRPLVWTAWYPADVGSVAEVPLETSWFRREAVIANAPASRACASFPLVLLSHGTGATGVALEWLAFRLAQQGYIALAIDHHGNTGSEPYRAEGFLCMWERAADFKAILDQSSWRSELGVEINNYIFAAGFSAGAYTALLLAGARVAFSQFEPDNPLKSPVRGPREFRTSPMNSRTFMKIRFSTLPGIDAAQTSRMLGSVRHSALHRDALSWASHKTVFGTSGYRFI